LLFIGLLIWVRSVSEEYVPTGVDEFKKFMDWLLNADPIVALAIAGVKRMSPSAKYIVRCGQKYVAALKQAFRECKSKDLRSKCVREVAELRAGVDFNTIMNGIKNFFELSLALRSESPNAQRLIAKVSSNILLGERREVSYHIGGWLGRSGIEFTRLGRRREEEEE